MDKGRHSDYIWISLFLNNWTTRGVLFKEIKEFCRYWKLPFSYQNYDTDTEQHLTFRIGFKDEARLSWLREWLELHEDCLTETSDVGTPKLDYDIQGYDEQAGVKFAYVLGTDFANQIQDHLEISFNSGVNHKEFLLLTLHGMFNSMGYTYKDEREQYIYNLNRMMQND